MLAGRDANAARRCPELDRPRDEGRLQGRQRHRPQDVNRNLETTLERFDPVNISNADTVVVNVEPEAGGVAGPDAQAGGLGLLAESDRHGECHGGRPGGASGPGRRCRNGQHLRG